MSLVVETKTYEVVEQKQKTIRYIVHLSDIHIQKADRMVEYRYVFNKLFQELSSLQLNNDNTVIVVTGDIIHDKNVLTGSSVDLLKDFFLGLSSIATTFCIIGNHDLDLSSRTLDSISPVIGRAFTTKYPVHVLLDDCVYEYNNILFGVTTLWATKVTPCTRKDGMTTIGLYHGIVEGGKNDDGFDLSHLLLQSNTRCFKVNDFKQYYDFTLLGDIHKRQALDNQKTVMYAGSLVQRDFGESMLDHGFGLVDILEKKTQFHRIANKYGKLKVNINDDGTNNIDETINYPENLEIKFSYKAKDQDLADKACEALVAKNIKIERTNQIDYSDYELDMKVGSTNIINLKSKEAVINLINGYIADPKFKLDEITKTNIIAKLNSIMEEIDFKPDNKCKRIKLEYLEFRNLMIYGGGNFIHFDKFRQIVGLSGENNIGKSALIDILIFAIYGECLRGTKADIIRMGETDYHTIVRLDVNGKKYTIKREGSLLNKKVDKKGSCHNTAIDKKLEKVNKVYAGETVYFTEAGKTEELKTSSAKQLIESKICSLEDLKKTSIILQQDDTSFITLTDKEKKDLLCKFVGIEIFDDIATKVNSRFTVTSRLKTAIENDIRKFKKYGINITDIVNNIKKTLMESMKNRDDTNQRLSNLIDQKSKLEISRAEIDTKIDIIKNDKHYNVNIKLESVDDIVGMLSRQRVSTTLIEKELSDLNAKVVHITDILNQYDDPENILKKFNDAKANKINRYTAKLNGLYKAFVNDLNTDLDAKEVNLNEKKLITKINLQKDVVNKLENELQTTIGQINDVIIDDQLELKYNEYVSKQVFKEEVQDVVRKLNDEHRKYINMADEFKDYEYDPNCQYCVSNCMTKQKQHIDSSLNRINADLETQKGKLQEMDNYLKRNANIPTQYEAMKTSIKANIVNRSKAETLQLRLEKERCQLELLNAEQSKINEDKRQLEAIENNRLIDAQIKELSSKVDELSKLTCTNYDMCIRFRNYRDTYRNHIEKTMKMSKENSDIIKNLEDYLKLANEKSEIAKRRQELAKQILDLTRMLDDNTIELDLVQTQIDDCRKTLDEQCKLYEEVMLDNDRITNLKTRFDEQERDKKEYSIIISMFGDKGDGIINGLLSSKIVPRLESIINQLCKNMNISEVSMSFSDGDFSICRKEGGTKVYMNGGYVNHIANMIFRIALMQINNYIKPNFIIIDEVFDKTSSTNKKNILKLMDQLKLYYDFALVVSHDLEIKANYDHTLKIESDGKCSKIAV